MSESVGKLQRPAPDSLRAPEERGAPPGGLAFAPLSSGSLAEEVADHLYAAVVERRIRPGQRLSEAALARAFGISRGPIREAQRLLERRGLLAFQPRRGFFVRELSPREVEDLFGLRERVERYAVALAAERASDAELAQLRRWQERLEGTAATASLSDASRLVEEDLALHRLICHLSGNASLISIYEPILTQLRLALSMINVGFRQPGKIVAMHAELIEALLDRDPARAEAAVSAHLGSSLSRLLSRLEEQQGEAAGDRTRDDEEEEEAGHAHT